MHILKQLVAFRPSKLDWVFAIKTYIAAMLALFISFQLDLLNPIWSIGTVMIIANPYAGMLSSKALYRVAGTAIGAVVAVALMPHLINTPWLFASVISGWVGFCLYISLLDRTPRSYMLMLSGYTVAMIVFNAINTIDAHSIFDIALARFLEIGIAVICSAVVSAVILPAHIGPIIQQRVESNLTSLDELFKKILLTPHLKAPDYSQDVAVITRDMSELHSMAVHLWFENSDLKGMTKPVQEMLHQCAMAVTNLVAMSERLKQLQPEQGSALSQTLAQLSDDVLHFLHQNKTLKETELDALSDHFSDIFTQLKQQVDVEHLTVVSSFQMDLRHYIYNVHIVRFIWQGIQQGRKDFPENIVPLTTNYPSLHRDHGVAVRGGIAAVCSTFFAIAVWILSGWKAGFMMAQMAAVCSCILTAIDNPIPALKIFFWGSISAFGIVFIYVFAIFPSISQFWQLALVLAPAVITFTLLIARPNLMALGLVLGVVSVMSMNLQNRYAIDAVSFFDADFAMILGVLCALVSLYFIRAMSPEETATRILQRHYRAMRKMVHTSYGVGFRVRLRGMIDRIGVLNSKLVQSKELKQAMHHALVETSATVDLSRIHELASSQLISPVLQQSLFELQTCCVSLFKELEKKGHVQTATHEALIRILQNAYVALKSEENSNIKQRTYMSLNNIQHSIFKQVGITHAHVEPSA
ncbi:FUSC family protein [Acinetobacter sp. B10A]|uniref:FUSC family protein n=1 Tax=Acinetobacter baretiae TaxID=2605383 RepID=UPI001B3C9AE7|nr:FUSC family protein [Acinetobacter baretiae]MBF7686307.1 FUSC family protein [Acinetobacter baretiae]